MVCVMAQDLSSGEVNFFLKTQEKRYITIYAMRFVSLCQVAVIFSVCFLSTKLSAITVNVTGSPIGHILDRCLRAIRVQLPNKDKFAKLRPCYQSIEKYLHFPREHFLTIMTGVQYKGFYLEPYSS